MESLLSGKAWKSRRAMRFIWSARRICSGLPRRSAPPLRCRSATLTLCSKTWLPAPIRRLRTLGLCCRRSYATCELKIEGLTKEDNQDGEKREAFGCERNREQGGCGSGSGPAGLVGSSRGHRGTGARHGSGRLSRGNERHFLLGCQAESFAGDSVRKSRGV